MQHFQYKYSKSCDSLEIKIIINEVLKSKVATQTLG